jgi:hypothetical protein
MTEAEAYAAGQHDELDGKPMQKFDSRDERDAYAFGRLVASGFTMMSRTRIAGPREGQ